MNQKYIDFVPRQGNTSHAKRVMDIKRTPKKRTSDPFENNFDAEETIIEAEPISREPNFGVIEDFRPKFVRTEVIKRPLSAKTEVETDIKPETVQMAKSKKVGSRMGIVKKPVKAPATTKAAPAKNTKAPAKMTLPKKATFINTEKVVKRPLSKNVYTRKVVVPKEKPSGPVTIIQKPEKDSRIGLIVAIILTIILGATAGTVAFLLLPK